MKHRGISGAGVIAILLALIAIGYTAYQISRPHFGFAAIKGKAENAAEMGLAQSDDYTRQELIETARDQKVILIADQIYIDHSLRDSLRIYVEYDDSSSIFGIYTYRKHFVIDVVKRMKSS